MVKFFELKSHQTKDGQGKENGFILPLWKDSDAMEKIQPRYVYFTTCDPGTDKGPYLHEKRRGLLCVIEGKILFVYKDGDVFKEKLIDSDKNPTLIDIPSRTPYLIRNQFNNTAKLINICDYPWISGDTETVTPNFGDYFDK